STCPERSYRSSMRSSSSPTRPTTRSSSPGTSPTSSCPSSEVGVTADASSGRCPSRAWSNSAGGRAAAVPKDRERGAAGRVVARLRLLRRRRQPLVRGHGLPLFLGRWADRRERRRSVRRAAVRAGHPDDPALGGEIADPLRAATVLPTLDGSGPRAVRRAPASPGGAALGLTRRHGVGVRVPLALAARTNVREPL